MNEVKKHRTAGGSSAGIWVHCTGYLGLKAISPPQPPTEHTEKGSEVHALCEEVADAFLQRKITGEPNTAIQEKLKKYEDQEAVENALTYASEIIWEKVLNESITGKAYGIEDEFVLSERLDIGGWIDFWCVWRDNRAKGVLEVVDYKNGYVEVDDFIQLILYACAARAEFRALGKIIDYANLHYHQPKSDTPYKHLKVTGKQLDTWEAKFIAAVEQAYTNPKFKVGEWCKKCHLRPNCQKYLASPRANTSLKLLDHRISALPEPESVPDEVLVQLILKAKEVKSFFDKCIAHGMARHVQGSPLPGLKVVRGKGRSSWIQDTAQAEEVLKSYGLDDIYSYKLKGITAIKGMLKDQGYKGKEADEALVDITFKKEPKPTLVTEDDPRPAILTFDDLLPDASEEGQDE